MSRCWIGMALLVLALVTAPTRSAATQPYAGGLLAVYHQYGVHKFCDGWLHLVSGSSATTMLAHWGCYGSSAARVMMDRTNRKAVLITDYPGGLRELDLLTLNTLSYPLPQPYYLVLGGLPNQIGGLTLQVFGTNLQTDLIQMDAAYTSYTTLRASISSSMGLACRDLTSGGYIVLDHQRAEVQRLSPDGTTLTTLFTAANLVDVVQSHIDGSYFVATGRGIYRLAGPVVTSLSPSRNYTRSICFDRWTGQGALVAMELLGSQVSVIHRMTPSGASVTSLSPNVTGYLTDMVFARGRNMATEHLARWNHWSLRLSFPGEAGRPYALALSATGFTPGMPVAGRVFPLVPDPLFYLTATGNFPFLTGASGTLDVHGEAQASLDLRPFGRHLRGLVLWAAALTLDVNSPGGIATIPRPVVLVLE